MRIYLYRVYQHLNIRFLIKVKVALDHRVLLVEDGAARADPNFRVGLIHLQVPGSYCVLEALVVRYILNHLLEGLLRLQAIN